MKNLSLAELIRRIFFYIFLSVMMPAVIAFIFHLKYIISNRGEVLSYNEHLDGLIFGAIIYFIFFLIWSVFSFFIYDIIIYNFSQSKILNRKSNLLIQLGIGILTTIVMQLSMDKYWIQRIWGTGLMGYFLYFLFLLSYSFIVYFLHCFLIDKRFYRRYINQDITSIE